MADNSDIVNALLIDYVSQHGGKGAKLLKKELKASELVPGSPTLPAIVDYYLKHSGNKKRLRLSGSPAVVKKSKQQPSSSSEESSDSDEEETPKQKAKLNGAAHTPNRAAGKMNGTAKSAVPAKSSSSEESSSEEEVKAAMKAAPVVQGKKASTAKSSKQTPIKPSAPLQQESSSEESTDDSSDEEPQKATSAPKITPKANVTAKGTPKATKPAESESSDTSDSSDEEVVAKPKAAPAKPVSGKAAKKEESSSEDDSSEEEEAPKKVVTPVATKKVQKKKESSSDDSDDDDSDDSDSKEKPASPAKKAHQKSPVVTPTAGQKRAREENANESFGRNQKIVKSDGAEDNVEVFVQNLDSSLGEDSLYEYFKKYGTVERVHIPIDRATGQARGIAFIKFGSCAEAKAVLSDGSDHEHEGFSFQCSEPRKKAAIGGNRSFGGGQNNENAESVEVFVNRLDYGLEDNFLYEYFKKFGNVERARVAKDRETGESRGFAFITFSNPDEVKKVVAAGVEHEHEGYTFACRAATKEPSSGEHRQAGPFRRVRAEEMNLDPKFNNAFNAKGGDTRNDWGYRAHQDLMNVRGRDFKQQKSKKKRASYSGGSITTSVHSIKFD